VEAAIERAAEVERRTYRESLQNNAEQIRMSRRLATILTDVPMEFSLESVKAQPADAAALKALYKELEFHSLLKELGPGEDTRERDYRRIAEPADSPPGWIPPKARPWRWPSGRRAPAPQAEEQGLWRDAATGPALEIGLAWRAGEARAVAAENLPRLKAWLEDPNAVKIACDVKSALLALDHAGNRARGFQHDVMLYAFLLDADPSGCALEEQARRRLDLKLGPSPEQRADVTLELFGQTAPLVDARGLRELYASIELPLAGVLARMERVGVRIDAGELKRLSDLMAREIARLTQEIHSLAGKPFNIASPQQLGACCSRISACRRPRNPGRARASPPPPTCWTASRRITKSCARCSSSAN
jgi:DNA polymerase-1